MQDGPSVSRRAILRAGALAGAVGLVLGLEGAQTVLPWDGQTAGGSPKLELRPTPSFVKTIYRRDDQLCLRLECYNLKLLKKGQPGPGDVQTARLVKLNPATDAFIVVDFGPQHLAEHAYQEVPWENVFLPAPTMLAGASRLAFKAPAAPIPYLFGNLMAWQNLIPSLVPHAIGPAAVRAPLPTETALEVPWKLVLSPDQSATWIHPMLPVFGSGGRAGLWQTRLDATKVRVVWTPDLDNAAPADPAVPGATSLQPVERRNLVKLTAQWNLASESGPYVPKPVDVEQLTLSPLGAWLKSTGTWDIRPVGVDLKQWEHNATMGRDHLVRTVEAGRLFPLGHHVELVKLTQRKFELVNGKPTAVLRQKFFIVPRERVRTYEDGDIHLAPNGLRDMPFKMVRLLTPVSPDLAPYQTLAESGNVTEAELETRVPDPFTPGAYVGRKAFWPRVGSPNNWSDVLWEIEAQDWEGRTVRFTMPLMYLALTYSSSGAMPAMKTYYETVAAASRRTRDLAGQKVAFASFEGGQRGETAYPVATFTFGVHVFLKGPPSSTFVPYDFTPRMIGAGAQLEAVDRIKRSGSSTPTAITLHPQWISDGDSPAVNPARVFAALTLPVNLTFAANNSGGVAAPDMRISALSALTGPIDAPDIDAAVPATFNPDDFFMGADPKVLGTISLKDILDEVAFPSPGAMALASGLPPVPRLVSTEILEDGKLVGVHTALVWQTPVVSIPDVFQNEKDGAPAQLTLTAQTFTYFDGRPPSTEVAGEIVNFTVNAAGPFHVIDLLFNRFGFVSTDGKKPDVSVSIYDVQFVGALEFVNVLRDFMGGDGIGASQAPAMIQAEPANGAYLNVSTSGIEVGYNLTLPPVPCGALLLENISFGARVDLFFDGRPMRMRFNFAERDRPFCLTVMCFGGGGSVAVTLGLDTFELFEMTLEFGAKLALDIGVASGSISAMAGIYIAIGDTNGDLIDDGARLTGYLRLNGELDILGIISMAIEFYLAFTYIDTPESCYGEATVTVEIEVLFFSGSVTLGPIKKTFAGGGDSGTNALSAKSAKGAPPAIASSTPVSFTQMTSSDQWLEYADMFAGAAF